MPLRQRTFQLTMGSRTSGIDALMISGFNVERIVIGLNKLDAASGGQVFAYATYLKYFDMLNRFRHDDNPSALYGFFPPDAGTTAHEAISGATLAISGTGPGVQYAAPPGPARYAGVWGRLPANNVASITANLVFLTAAEQAGLSWTWMSWVYFAGVGSECYIEYNAGATVYLAIFVLATGAVFVTKGGAGMGGTYTSAAGAVPVNLWAHVGLIFNAATGQITCVVNGAAVGTPTAYTRATSGTVDRIGLNRQQTVYLAGMEVYYNAAFTVADVQRHYNYATAELLTGNYGSTPATIASGQTVGVLFSNNVAPGWDAGTATLRMPLTSINFVQTWTGIYQCSVDVWEEEHL